VYERECVFITYGDPYPDADKASTYLYALVEIEEEFDIVHVRYIGQSESPARRLIEHVLRPGTLERVRWIGKLLNKSEFPQMAIFDIVSKSIADQMELAAIYAFSSCEVRWDEELGGFSPLENALLNIRK
jgi:hypothetical protein